jgi:hypothetical protein
LERLFSPERQSLAAHEHSHGDGIGNFPPCGPRTPGALDVAPDAMLIVRCDSQRECDQLFDRSTERMG